MNCKFPLATHNNGKKNNKFIEEREKWRRRWDLNPRTGKPVQVSNLLQLTTMRRLQSD